LEIVNHFLILDKFSQCLDICDCVPSHFTWIQLCFITDNVGAIQHLEHACLHLVCVIVFPWLKSHFRETFSRDFDVHLERQYVLQQSPYMLGLLRIESRDVETEVSKWLWIPRMDLAHQIQEQVFTGNLISF